MSPCVENSQNHTLMFCCSPIPGRRFEKLGKLWYRFVPYFFYILFTRKSLRWGTSDSMKLFTRDNVLNEKKIIKCLTRSQTRPKISVSPPLKCTYLAQHSNAVLSVTLEIVNLDLE